MIKIYYLKFKVGKIKVWKHVIDSLRSFEDSLKDIRDDNYGEILKIGRGYFIYKEDETYLYEKA